MQTREFRFTDKSAWGEGPWQSEPDKKQWTDPVTGLPCLIVRGPSGALCGYVGVSEGHPWFGLSYSAYDFETPGSYEASPMGATEIHGGLTFSDRCAEGDPDHGICHRPDEGEADHVWWFGFDCAHSCDETPGSNARYRQRNGGSRCDDSGGTYRDQAYVEAECASLAKQLVAVPLFPSSMEAGR